MNASLELTMIGADHAAVSRHARAAGFHVESDPAHDDLYLARTGDVTPEATLALLRELPFEACTMGRLDPSWWEGYRSIHGWAFALRGRGHRLVSPRVIERGPWRVWHDGDVTLIQFHDLGVDGDTALAQARAGHALLAPMWRGGHYASTAAAFRAGAASSGYAPTFYDGQRRTSIVLVQDREVSAAEMGVAAGSRVHAIFPEPVEQVAFVYLDEAVARRQLPALWLYGLEVRAITAAGERRLDESYQPIARIAATLASNGPQSSR